MALNWLSCFSMINGNIITANSRSRRLKLEQRDKNNEMIFTFIFYHKVNKTFKWSRKIMRLEQLPKQINDKFKIILN